MTQVPLAPPPPTGGPLDGWLYLLWRRLTQSGQVLWASLDFSGSNLTDLATRNHADLQNIDTSTYTHLTSTQATDLTDGGDTTLHYHSADRGAGASMGGMDGEDGQDGLMIPGAIGPQGIQGQIGPQGLFGFAIDGEDGDDGIPIPGARGDTGQTGTTGTAGAIGLGLDGQDGEDGMAIPGPQGIAGNTGSAGPAGPAIFLIAEDGEEGMMGVPGPAGSGGSSIAAWVLPFAAAHG